MRNLERAIAIAVTAHTGTVDKAGQPYILHPLRVMLSLDSTEDRIVGMLHDVVEDSSVTFDMLRAEGYSDAIIAAVDSVTRRKDEDYDTFILRAAANPIGRRVKLADLKDNCDLSRLSRLTPTDWKRVEKYIAAIQRLKSWSEISS